MIKKLLKSFFVFLVGITLFLPFDTKADTIIESLSSYFDLSSSPFDIRANNGDIITTYSNAGYETKFRLSDNPISRCDDEEDYCEDPDEYTVLNIENNGITYNETNDGFLKISSINKNSNTIEVTYELVNNTGKKKHFAIASYSDVQLGPNDDAAITKNNKDGFKITQDNDNQDYYASQLNISLLPSATTTWIGDYDFRYSNRYTNGNVEYYTINDGVDTGLAYSWQGEINSGETKTFKAIFGMKVADMIKVNYYPLNENGTYDSTPQYTKKFVEGGAIKLEEINHQEEGYNFKWYQNKNGSGVAYLGGQTLIAPNNDINLYEVKKSNTVMGEDPYSKNFGDGKVIIDNDIINDFISDRSISYDDVKLMLTLHDSSSTIPENEKQLFYDNLKNDYKINLFLDAKLLKILNNDYDNKEEINELNNLITIRFIVPVEYRNKNSMQSRKYKMLRLHDGIVEEIDTNYNEKTGELTFKTDKFSSYALIYKDFEITNPKTYDNANVYFKVGILSIIVIGLSVLYIRKRTDM